MVDMEVEMEIVLCFVGFCGGVYERGNVRGDDVEEGGG